MSEMMVGVRELKARLSEYMRRVKAGQIVIITEHGTPIGRIVPETQSIEDRLQGLVESGLVAWSGKKVTPYTPVVVNRSEKLVSDLLVEMRE